MADRIGNECKVYYSADLLDGDTVTPETATWQELTNVRDVTKNRTRAEVDRSVRGNARKRTRVGMIDDSADLELLYETDNDLQDALEDAYEAGNPVALAFMDGDIATSGAKGVVGNWAITNFTEPQPLEDNVVVNLTLKHHSEGEPYEVS